MCKKSKSRGVHGIVDRPGDPSSDESDIELVAGVAVDSQESDVYAFRQAKEICAAMLIDDRKVTFQIDCGTYFIMASPPSKRSEPKIKQITTEEVVKQYSDVFDRPLVTFPGEVHLEVDDSVKPLITRQDEFPKH